MAEHKKSTILEEDVSYGSVSSISIFVDDSPLVGKKGAAVKNPTITVPPSTSSQLIHPMNKQRRESMGMSHDIGQIKRTTLGAGLKPTDYPGSRPSKLRITIPAEFERCRPSLSCKLKVPMLEAVHFQVVLWMPDVNHDPDHTVVQVWTNAPLTHYSENEFHSKHLVYAQKLDAAMSFVLLGREDDRQEEEENREPQYMFTNDINFTSAGSYEFTYRFKADRHDREWTWFDQKKSLGILVVEPAREKAYWTPVLQKASSVHAVGPIFIGNAEVAATAKKAGFTHLLCCAQELNEPQDLTTPGQKKGEVGITFMQIPIKDGVMVPISTQHIEAAVNWLTSHWEADNRILLYSARGFGRAGGILLAFVLASNPVMSFAEARRFVSFKWPIFVHVTLRSTLEKLYPRI